MKRFGAPSTSVSKQQFLLPLNATKSPPHSRSVIDREGRGRAIPFSGPVPNESIVEPQIAGPARDQALPTSVPVFVAMTDLANLRAAGITYPSTIHGWRWLFRHRHERGLHDAFRRIGRRIVVDPQALPRARPRQPW